MRSGISGYCGHKLTGYLNMYFCFRNLTKSMLRKSSSCFGRLRKCYSKGKWVPRPRTSWPNAVSGQEDPSISGTEMAINVFRDGALIYTQLISAFSAIVTESIYPFGVFIQNSVLSWQVTPFIIGPKETLIHGGITCLDLSEANPGHSQKDVIYMADARLWGVTLHLHIHSVWVTSICPHWGHESVGVGDGNGGAPETEWSFAEKLARWPYSLSTFLHIRGDI